MGRYHTADKKKLYFLRSQYNILRDSLYNYKKYTQSCTGAPLTPRQLNEKWQEVQKDMNKLTRKLVKKGVLV